MNNQNRLYTVENVAEMLGLTDRTIRNYLKDGVLKGSKVGGQWRFTEGDIAALLEEKEVNTTMNREANNEVLEFLSGKTNIRGDIKICTVIDRKTDAATAQMLAEKVCSLVNVANDENGIRMNFDYDLIKKNARFILIGDYEFISKASEIIAG